MLRFLAISLIVFPALNFSIQKAEAQEEFMQAAEIRRTITQARIMLQFPVGEFPLTYRADGTVTGDGEALGLGRFFAPRETGRWWLDGNNLCQQWPTWYDGQSFCFQLQKLDEDRLRWLRDDGESGRARLVPLSG